MQIRLAQLNYHIGNFQENARSIIGQIGVARTEGVDLIIFSELAVCGYPPRDLLDYPDFIDECEKTIAQIAAVCVGITAIIGAPVRNTEPDGKRLFNAALVLENGSIKQVIRKALLPDYDVFDEYRYFEAGTESDIVEIKGVRIAVTICEDLWNIENPLYGRIPMEQLSKKQPHLMVNIAASPFDLSHREDRLRVLGSNCRKYGLPVLYVNHIGAQTELIFDGGSLAMNAQGELLHELNYFEEDVSTFRFEHELELLGRQPACDQRCSMERIHDALVLGIGDYFRKSGLKTAVLGLSGGLDSAVVLYLAQKALGPENVRTLLMPSEFSSDHSIEDSVRVSENLKTQYDVLGIQELFKGFQNNLAPLFGNLPFGLAEENLQARIRGVLLMAVSNKFGHIVLNTSNKSECAVGYSTLYGDMNGGLAVIADLYKTQVYELARWINRNEELIPEHILTKAPSAELRSGQKDSDSLPEYALLDSILIEYLENRKGYAELVELGLPQDVVKRILRLVNMNEHKRYQAPPVLRVSKKAFGMGRRMPIVAKYPY